MQDETFPSIPQALVLCLALFLIEVIVACGLVDVSRVAGLTASAIWALTMVLANGAVFAMLMSAKRMTYRQLFHPSASPVHVTAVMLIPPVALLVPGLLLVSGWVSQLMMALLPLSAAEERMFANMRPDSIAALVSLCLLAPVLEEMLFRGIFLRAFLVRYPRGLAIGASALIFGVAHLNIYQFVSAFLMGLLAGWLYERSRSLVAPIALHFLYNTAIALLMLSGAEGNPQSLWNDGTLVLWAPVCGLLGAGWLYGMFGRRGQAGTTA